MGKPKVSAGGGFPAIFYTFKKAFEAGGLFKFFSRMASKNTCKTCALGMGGQKGGMVNEAGHWPEFCKKSVQAQASDMTGVITEAFLEKTPIAHLAKMSSRELENLGRIAFPMIAEKNDTHFRKISWNDAMIRMASGFLNTTPDRVFFYSSGRASNEAAFLLQLVARAYGTSNINNCSYYCHQASGVALKQVYGSSTASITLDDLEKTDLAIVVGANPASNHPRLITQLVALRKRGGKVIVINPLKELGLSRFRIPSRPDSLLFGSTVSDLYIQPKVGTDIYLFKALLKRLIESGHLDEAFIANHTSGWEAVRQDTVNLSLESLLTDCGVSKESFDQLLQMMKQSHSAVLMWAMGLTHHAHGVDTILALCNIALSQGWLGKPGSGLLPIRGHSNVQGVGTVGVAPAVQEAFAKKMEDLFHITVPRETGLDTFASMRAAAEGKIDAAFLLGGNLYGSNPDAAWAQKALGNIPLVVMAGTKFNTGYACGRGQTTLVLPVLARDEEPQPTTQESMFNYVRLSDGGKPSVKGDMRSEVKIIADLAERILPKNGFDWSRLYSHAAIRQSIAEVIPALKPLESIDQTAQEFQISGRTFHTPRFATPDGKAVFQAVNLPASDITPFGEFRLMTLRSEGQFNTVVYEEEDLYRGNTRRDVVMMARDDAQRFHLEEGHSVYVETLCGKMTAIVSVIDISPGSLAMYYPEANVLVPQVIDPKSKTPAFKSVSARILKA